MKKYFLQATNITSPTDTANKVHYLTIMDPESGYGYADVELTTLYNKETIKRDISELLFYKGGENNDVYKSIRSLQESLYACCKSSEPYRPCLLDVSVVELDMSDMSKIVTKYLATYVFEKVNINTPNEIFECTSSKEVMF